MPTAPSAFPESDAPSLSFTLEAGFVGAGGACGAIARAAIAARVPGSGGAFVATTILNLCGAFALGIFFADLERRGPRPRWRAFLAVGVLGSFTTFSTLADECVRFAGPACLPMQGFLPLAVSLALGIGAYHMGHWIGLRGFAADSMRGGARTS